MLVGMTTPVHLAINTGVYVLVGYSGLVEVNATDLALLFAAELIDLDHLFSTPIYHPRRNPFHTHFLHRSWKAVLIISLLMCFFRPLLFLGIGLLSHMVVDYWYVKIYCSNKQK